MAYSNSGLLCAIDNYPANGVQNCGQSVGSGDYDYWSYWHGASGSWVYASDGPAEQSVSSPADDVEGWRFQTDEPDNPSDPPPGRRAVLRADLQCVDRGTAGRRHRLRRRPPPPRRAVRASAAPTPATTSTERRQAATTTHRRGTTAEACRRRADHDHGGTRRDHDHATSGCGRHRTARGHGSRPVTAAADPPSPARFPPIGRRRLERVLPVILVAVVVAALGGLALFRWRRRPAEE